MLDDQSSQIFAILDPLAERVRKLGFRTLHSISEVGKQSRIAENDRDFVPPLEMLRELIVDNKTLTKSMREAHEVCDNHKDVASASLLEVYIDAAERRSWFLFEASRIQDDTGRS
jgi:starvation-inducible DNA-binding protein